MLSGRVALVTGAAQGIGRACAELLASNGAYVACVDLSSSKDTINTIGASNGKEYIVDISKKENVDVLINDITTKAQNNIPPTICINAAGITRDGWLWKMSEKDYDDVLTTNLKAPFLLTQAVSKNIIQHKNTNTFNHQEQASIINISSIIGKVGNLGQANYAASKAGLIGLTKSSAKDLARHGIRVNAILPGFITTPMALAVPEKILEKTRQQIPLGELGESRDIAEAALYLSGSQSKYVTGSVLEVTGGLYM